MSILDLFVSVDAFWQGFEPLWERERVAAGRQRRRATRLSPSEIMTILILFQQSGYRTFKGCYTQYVQTQLRAEFPHLVSYSRFVTLIPRVVLPLAVYLQTQLGTRCWQQLCRLDRTRRLPQCPHQPASRLCRRCAPGEDLGGLVLRLQAASDGQ